MNLTQRFLKSLSDGNRRCAHYIHPTDKALSGQCEIARCRESKLIVSVNERQLDFGDMKVDDVIAMHVHAANTDTISNGIKADILFTIELSLDGFTLFIEDMAAWFEYGVNEFNCDIVESVDAIMLLLQNIAKSMQQALQSDDSEEE
jgi:hypothetical protein